MRDRLKANAYRVLRLSADATLSDIHKAAGSMRRAVSLGVANTTEADMPELGEIFRTEADIRAAIGRLENHTQRLSDRLFWFHLPLESRNAKAPALPREPDGCACAHDNALRGLIAVFEAGFDNARVSAWTSALRAWHLVVADDDYWAYIAELEEQGDFEPAAFPSDLDALRDEAVGLAAEPLVVAGRDALARDERATVQRVVAAIGEMSDTGLWAATAQHDIVAPAVERFRALCHTIREDFSAKVVREQDSGERNKSVCDAALKRFRDKIEPELNRVLQIVPPDHWVAQESREEAALCLSGIASDFTWAADFITSENLREEALRLAQDTLVVTRIEDGLPEIREAASKQRMFEAITPISLAAIERLRKLCLAIREEFSLKIVREQNAGKHNKSICDAALKRFRGEIKPSLSQVLELLPRDHEAAQQSRDRAALCLNAIATDYTWADDFIVSENVREEALLLANDAEVVNLIETGLAETRDTAHHQRLFGEPIFSAPSLFTLNGFGVTLYGNSDYDKNTQSYATTHYVVALFVPLFPIGRYRVINTEGSQYRFLGKLPLRAFDRWHLGIVAAVIFSMIITSTFSSQGSTVSYAPSSNSPTEPSPIIAPTSPSSASARWWKEFPPIIAPTSPFSNSPTEPSPIPAPTSRRSQMSALKSRIDSGRSQMTSLKAQLRPVIDEIKSLNAQMEPLKADLKSLDEQQKLGLQIDIDGYNVTVNGHNALLAKQRALIAANSTDLKTYDDLVDQDSALVKQYNALLK